jgi:hypothetical protein
VRAASIPEASLASASRATRRRERFNSTGECVSLEWSMRFPLCKRLPRCGSAARATLSQATTLL